MALTQVLAHRWGPRFQHCFAEGLNQSLVLSMAQARISLRKTQGFGMLVFTTLIHILAHKRLMLILMLMLWLCLLCMLKCRDQSKSYNY